MNSYLNKLKTIEERFKRVKSDKGLPIIIKPGEGGYVLSNGIKLFKSIEDVRVKYPTSLIIIDDLAE